MAGGQGYSWFDLALIPQHVDDCEPQTGGVGESWFTICLTPNHVDECEPQTGGVGESWFTICLTPNYVLPEEPVPSVVAVRQFLYKIYSAVPDSTREFPYDIAPTLAPVDDSTREFPYDIRSAVSDSVREFPYDIYARVTSTLEALYNIAVQPGEAPEIQPGGSDVGVYGAGPLVGDEFEIRIPCVLDISFKDFSASIPGSVSGYLDFAQRTPGMVFSSRNVEFRTDGVRLSAERWNRLLAEDDDLMMML